MEKFTLNERIDKDSFFIANLSLCEVRLIDNKNYLWFLLVPKIANIVHITDLSQQQQLTLMQEIDQVSKYLQKKYQPDRLNIAALGNIVSQMHWHIIVRYNTDKAWPNPVWGAEALPYAQQDAQNIIQDFQNAFLG